MTFHNVALAPQILPIIWAIVSIATALILYRTSQSLISTPTGASGRRVRLTGSVVIAALTFYGLSWATRLQMTADPNVVAVSTADIAKARDQASALADAAMQASACRAIDDGGTTCSQQTSDVERRSEALRDQLATLGSSSDKKAAKP